MMHHCLETQQMPWDLLAAVGLLSTCLAWLWFDDRETK